jgi:hypothetical protein
VRARQLPDDFEFGQDPSEDLSYFAANAMIGGLTAGIASQIRGRGFMEAFVKGALGGGLSFFGKRITAEPIGGAGFVGRQVGALGASIVRSSAFGSGGLLDTLVVPLGPLRAYVVPGQISSSTWRVDLEEMAWLVYGLTSPRLSFSAVESLSSGSLVFTSEGPIRGDGDTASGRAAPGIISVRLDEGGVPNSVLAHERVHINQFDFVKIVGGLPAEGLVRRGFGLADVGWLEHVDFGIGEYPFVFLLTGQWLPRSRQIFEIEAEYYEAR